MYFVMEKMQLKMMKSNYCKYLRGFMPILLIGVVTIMVTACAEDNSINGSDGRNQLSVRFNVIDGQQITLSKRVAGLTRSISLSPVSNSDLAPKRLLADDGQHCFIQSTIEGVNPITPKPLTRGTVIKKTNLGDFSSSAYRGVSSSSISATPTWFYRQKTNGDGTLVNDFQWAQVTPYARFYAVYPEITNSYSKIKLSDESYTGTPYVDFEVEPNVENQKDLMTACTGEVVYNTPGVAPETNLMFQHALTAVKFSIGPNLSPMTINKVEIQNVLYKGRYTLPTAYDTPGTWDLSGHQSERTTVVLNCNPGLDASEMPNTVIIGKDGSNYTFFMLPQTLTGNNVKAKVYYTTHDGQSKTMIMTLKGSWIQGTTSEYKLSLKNSSWEYNITVGYPLTFNYDETSPKSYYVTSFRNVSGTDKKQPVAWKVIKYEESTDNGVTWVDRGLTKPEWFTQLDLTEGDGGDVNTGTVARDYGNVSVSRAEVIDHLKVYNDEMKHAVPKGTPSNYWNLANPVDGGNDIKETANSYLISAPGYYRIPLVYGNAVKNNTTNTSAFHTSNTGAEILQTFLDHNNKEIQHALINEQNPTQKAEKVEIVWSDKKEVTLGNSSIKQYPVTIDGVTRNVDFLEFEVKAEDICNGNAVIAIKYKNSNGTYEALWSWHLWFAHDDELNTIACKNKRGEIFNFAKQNLGFARHSWYDMVQPRKARITVEQQVGNTTKQKAVIQITQNSDRNNEFYTPVYQWGRKDAFYDSYPTSVYEGWVQRNFDKRNIGYIIKNPNTILSKPNGGGWYNEGVDYNYLQTDYLNLWSMNNKGDFTLNGNPENIVKTIYDPCPAGFHVPGYTAFTGIVNKEDTGWPSPRVEDCVVGDYHLGLDFKTNMPSPTSIFFSIGFLHQGITLTSYLWTAQTRNASNNEAIIFGYYQYGLYFAKNQDLWRLYHIRPVAEP